MQVPIFQEGVPRNRGSGQAAYERPLREGAHRRRPRRFFGDFLIAQKVTLRSRPAGRNLPQTQKNAPAGTVLRGRLMYWKRI